MRKKKIQKMVQKIVVSPYFTGENGPAEDIKRGLTMLAFSRILPMPLKFETTTNDTPKEGVPLILCFLYEELENGGVKLTGGIFSANSDSDNFKNALIITETIIGPPHH